MVDPEIADKPWISLDQIIFVEQQQSEQEIQAAAERLLAGWLDGKLGLMLDWRQCQAVERQTGKVSGAWVFKGTRVPVRALFENLQSGARIEDFLEWFPGVTRDHVDAVLKLTEQSLDVVAA